MVCSCQKNSPVLGPGSSSREDKGAALAPAKGTGCHHNVDGQNVDSHKVDSQHLTFCHHMKIYFLTTLSTF